MLWRNALRRQGALFLAASGLTLLLAPSAAAAPPTPPALFIQVASLAPMYSPAQVQTWIKRVCPGREVVLQSVVGPDGRLFQPYLDVIAPYLPGGARACFSRAFVGSVDLAWTGRGTKYVEGVQDPAFVSHHLSVSDAAARAFSARYPKARFGWYLTYEADLNQLYYPQVSAAYRSLLAAEMRSLRAVRPGAVMWSPTFAYPHAAYSGNTAGMAELRTNLIDLFSTLARTAGGVQILDLQDFVGGSGCQPAWNRVTPQDAVGWARFLIGLGQIPTVMINVEQFTIDCATGRVRPGDANEIASRTSFYARRGIALGPAFEIRYWLQANRIPL